MTAPPSHRDGYSYISTDHVIHEISSVYYVIITDNYIYKTLVHEYSYSATNARA